MLNTPIDPKSVGLCSRDVVIQFGINHYALFIDRKSRIVMADAYRIMEKVNTLARHIPKAKISVKTTAPVCSKTKKFLKSRQIDIIGSNM
ncbi:hypothetical protein JW835_11910 [bacterium]|nr:hypothetical protein [bacterium]